MCIRDSWKPAFTVNTVQSLLMTKTAFLSGWGRYIRRWHALSERKRSRVDWRLQVLTLRGSDFRGNSVLTWILRNQSGLIVQRIACAKRLCKKRLQRACVKSIHNLLMLCIYTKCLCYVPVLCICTCSLHPGKVSQFVIKCEQVARAYRQSSPGLVVQQIMRINPLRKLLICAFYINWLDRICKR